MFLGLCVVCDVISSKMYYKCCLCKSLRHDAILHHFPIAEKRVLKWLECINLHEFKKLSSEELGKLFICHKHFEKKFVTSKSRLKCNAFPSLFTKDEISSGIPSQDNVETAYLDEHKYAKKEHNDHNYYRQLAQHSLKNESIVL